MRRYGQNNDHRYYAYLPPTNSDSSRHSSSNSINPNAHYQYYDPRIRTQQQAQQTLYEYQYANTSPNRSPPSLYGSGRQQQRYYQPSSSFIQELPASSVNSISDLGEPISVFDDLKPLEYRRSTVVPALPSAYVPPNPTQRPSVSDVRLATAHVLREQLLTEIQYSINDIDRELTSLERRPSVSRYVPPRFSPIIELDPQDENVFRPTTTTIKPVRVSAKKPIPIITSPVQKQIQQTSAHSTTNERNSGGSQFWPNKPKRIYQVIPSLPSDSKKTSRQSSVGGQYEPMKISEIQSPPKTTEKQLSISSVQFHGQYHYGPEMEETEILPDDPENIDRKSVSDELREASFHEPLTTNEFLRELSAPPDNRALNFVPEYSSHSQMGYHESTEDLILNDQIDPNTARSSTASSLHELKSTKELIIEDTESLIQTAPENKIDPELTPRIPSRSTITPQELYHTTETDLRIQNDPILSDDIEQSPPSITTPIATDDSQEKSPALQKAKIHSTANSSRHSPLPVPSADNNVSGLVAYFFSDFGNEGEGDEDVITIDQSNFAVPTGAEIISDDDISNRLLGQSPASLLILHSAHVPRQQQQQQNISTIPPTIENNNERTKTEEKEEIGSMETDETKKRIPAVTSILPSSSPPLKQVLPTSIIDDMQTQFIRNNNSNHDNQHRQPSTTPLSMNTVDPNIEEQEKHSINPPIRLRSSSSKASQIHSRVPSTLSERNNEQIENNYEETRSISSTLLKNLDNERIRTPERIDTAEQRRKSTSRTLSRGLSTASNHTKKDEEIMSIDSPTKTSLKNIDRENAISRKSISHPRSIPPSEHSPSSLQRSASLRPSSTNRDTNQSVNILRRDQSNTSLNDIHRTPTNKNEPHSFTVESEHFLRNQSQTSPYNPNERLPSGYSISHPNDSRRSSTTSLTLPVVLDSPDIDNNQPSQSRATTPKRKTSISSMDLPPDPNTLFTTTDEPDPDDPSIINSTLHFQFLSSQQPNSDVSIPERDEPSPLLNIVPVQKFPSPIPSAESPTEEQVHEFSPNIHGTPIDENELEPNNEPPLVTPEIDIRLPSATPSNHEQEQPLRQTPSLSKNERQQESSHQSPLLSYPARLEDLMRPTPSPFLSAQEHKQEEGEEDQQQNDRLSSISPPMNEPEQHDHHQHPIHQNTPSKFEQNDIRLPSSSPHHSELSNTNHTSIEGDDTYRQQIDTPPISPEKKRVVSPDYHDHIDNNNNNNTNNLHHHYQIQKQTLISPPIAEPTFLTENQGRPSSERSNLSINSYPEPQYDENLYRNDPHLNSASVKFDRNRFFSPSSPPIEPTFDEEELPSITASQQHSKLSLRVKQEPKRKKSIYNELPPPASSSSPLQQIDITELTSMNNDEHFPGEKPKKRRARRVSFTSSLAHFQTEERQLVTNWRERVAAILASKHRTNEKYAHVQSRVNSFANFEYQPKKIQIIPVKISPPKTNEQSNFQGSKFIKRKKFKVKKPKFQPEREMDEQTDDEQHQNHIVKGSAPQLFGRLWCLPDGSPTVFHESLEWNVSSKLKAYSYENFNYERQRNDFKVHNKKPRWHSESKLAELLKESPRYFQRQTLGPASSLPSIPDRDEPYFHQQPTYQEPGTEKKIFDIQTTAQQQSEPRVPNENLSYGSRPSETPIFNEKLAWTGRSKLKDRTWGNINYQPKKSKVQIFHKTVHWNSEPKIRTRSPSTVQTSRASLSNVQIFDEKLNWDAQAKVHCWSEIDLRQLTKKKSIFAQYHDPKWNDIVTARVDATNYHYPKLANQVEIFSDRLSWTRSSGLKDYVWENFDYKSPRRYRQSNNQRHLHDSDQSPPNRPKWNAVSKTRSLNSVYNPKMTNSNMIRRGWDRELRRKRVQKLPPLKRKREREEIPHLAIGGSSSTGQLAIDYNYDQQGRTMSNGYARTSSRRSSKALVPINHSQFFSEIELPLETPRSQRPVQQEWYDEMSKSRLTHRTDTDRNTARSYRNSIDSIHHPNTPRELPTFRSSTRNSQNSVMSGTLLDSSVRTNRTTEFRLSKDMDEHHQHSHTPSQSMPIEIRGFKLEGTQLTVPDHATIRPLSNVSYGASERVKSRRIYPWSTLHPHGTSSRNSSLVPIAEFRRASLDTTITEAQQLATEE